MDGSLPRLPTVSSVPAPGHNADVAACAPVAATAPAARLKLVDGLRALAALAVVAYHFGTGTLRAPLATVLPAAVANAVRHGWLGVQVFFVLSGFVVAYTLRAADVTWPFAARFALRRQVRLDPPYWTMIAVGVLLPWGWSLAQPGRPAAIPSARAVLAHLVYAQTLLGYGNLFDVFWTLCLEVQFYLVFVAVLAATRSRTQRTAPMFVAVSGAASLALLARDVAVPGWFVPHWYLFALGALTWWALQGRVRTTVAVFALAVAATCGVLVARPEPVVGAVAAAVLYVGGRHGGMERWLAGAAWQYLGRISYALYLVHTVVAGQLLWILARALPPTSGPRALVLAACLFGASVAVAHALHVAVERPALRLAARLRRGTPAAA